MSALQGLSARLRSLLFRRSADQSLAEEIRFHLEMETERLARAGLSPAEARRRARLEFGGVDRYMEAARDGRPGQWLVDAVSDLRYTSRWLRREPLFAVVAVVCLGLGIGANTTLYSVVDALLFRAPAGVANAGSLVRVRLVGGNAASGARRSEPRAISYPDFLAVRDGAPQLAGVAAYAREPVMLLERGSATDLTATMVSGRYFGLLGVRPAVGRLLAPADDRGAGAAPVVVLSYALWRGRFGGDPGVVGRLLTLNGVAVRVVGVAARDFSGMDPGQPDVWLPLALAAAPAFGGPGRLTRGTGWLSLIARLRPGLDRRAVLRGPSLTVTGFPDAGAAAGGPAGGAGALTLQLAPPTLAAARTRGAAVPLWVMGVALAVLLVACGTVGTLLLARAARREREMATRLALGAGRARLGRQLLAESLVLALLGGGAALAFARVGVRVVRLLSLPALPPLLGLRAVLATGTLSLLATILAGLAPALWAVRRDPAAGLAAGGSRVAGGRSRLRGALMALQLTLSFALLAGAGLFLRSLQNVRATDVGFDLDHLVLVKPRLPRGFPPGDAAELLRRVSDRLSRLPEVRSVASGFSTPWGVKLFLTLQTTDAAADSAATLTLNGDRVSPRYFRTMGLRILRGRALDSDDRAGSTAAAVVSATLAGELWPGEDPIGRCIRVAGAGAGSDCLRVVGVAADARYDGVLVPSRPYVYLPAAQPLLGASAVATAPRLVLVRTRGAAEAATGTIRRAAQAVDASLAPFEVRTMADLMRPQLEPWAVAGTLFSAFGILAVLLAGIGLYVVVSFLVVQRERELGIRRALGADGGSIAGLLIGHALRLTGVGVAAGALVAAAVGRLVAARLYGVSPFDPITYGGIAALLTAVALAACIMPARRAARVDPMLALRAE